MTKCDRCGKKISMIDPWHPIGITDEDADGVYRHYEFCEKCNEYFWKMMAAFTFERGGT